MKYFLLLSLFYFFISPTLIAQVGINNVDPKSTLDISASSKSNPSSTDGVLIPRIKVFPTNNPTVDQNGMLVYLDSAISRNNGFYYWDAASTSWVGISGEWTKGKNTAQENLILAKQADDAGNKVVVTEDGFIGIGTDSPNSELHIKSKRSGEDNAGITVENLDDAVEIRMIPAAPGIPYTVSARNSAIDGFQVLEDKDVKFNIRNGGAVRITDLNSSNNNDINFPTTVFADKNGELFVGNKNGRSPNGDLVVNTTSVTAKTVSTMSRNTEVLTPSIYTYTITPTQDILLDISYQLDVKVTQAESANTGPENKEFAALYGAYIQVGPEKYAYSGENFTGDPDSFRGSYYINGNAFIPLDAGTAYTIEIIGFIHSPLVRDKGWRATFGSGIGNRVQILNRY